MQSIARAFKLLYWACSSGELERMLLSEYDNACPDVGSSED